MKTAAQATIISGWTDGRFDSEHDHVVLEQSKAHSKWHEEFMDEMREIKDMQREQRIDVMALFEGNRQMREMLPTNFQQHP